MAREPHPYADDAVGNKIGRLMDEGKPQKQAVAIALDMDRRGDLADHNARYDVTGPPDSASTMTTTSGGGTDAWRHQSRYAEMLARCVDMHNALGAVHPSGLPQEPKTYADVLGHTEPFGETNAHVVVHPDVYPNDPTDEMLAGLERMRQMLCNVL